MLQRALIGSLRLVASQKSAEDFDPSSIRSILVIELSRLGDIIAMLPSLARLQSFFNADMQVLVDMQYVSLLRAIELNVEFIGVANPQSAGGLLHAFRVARKHTVDLSVSMSPPRRNVMVALASDTRYKLGYLSYVDSLTPFLASTSVAAFGFQLPTHAQYALENIYERPAKICSALGIAPMQRDHRANLKPDIFQNIWERLNGKLPIHKSKYVMMHPFTGWEYRNWPLAKFIGLAIRIASELDHDVLISCEEKDATIINSLLVSNPRIRVVASSDLLEVAVLMKKSSLIIGNDSGPLHLAAMMHVPVVGLFGPAPPELTAPPRFRYDAYLYKKVDCSPCDQRKCIRPDGSCMTLHSVDEVFSTVSRVLEQSHTQNTAPTNV